MLVNTALDVDRILEVELSMLHRESFNFCGLSARLVHLAVLIGLLSMDHRTRPMPLLPENSILQ